MFLLISYTQKSLISLEDVTGIIQIRKSSFYKVNLQRALAVNPNATLGRILPLWVFLPYSLVSGVVKICSVHCTSCSWNRKFHFLIPVYPWGSGLGKGVFIMRTSQVTFSNALFNSRVGGQSAYDKVCIFEEFNLMSFEYACTCENLITVTITKTSITPKVP